METRLSGYGAYRTEYHIVWITKYRRRILNPGGYISKLFPKIMKDTYFGEIGHLFGLKTAGCPGKSATPIL
jgi:hypothetical protein